MRICQFTWSSSRGRNIIQNDQGCWPRSAELLCIQVNVTQIFEGAVLESLELPTVTGSTADVVKGKDASEYLYNEFRCNISTYDLESNICSEVPFTWGTSRVEGGGIRECFLLSPESQGSGRWIKYNPLTFMQALAISKKQCSPCWTAREPTVWSFLAI